MTFLFSHPFFLSLLPLALAPVLFHLFFRIRRKAVAFSTFMFFHRISPRLNARRKVRDWLILLLRALAVALFLLALSGPLLTAAGRGGRTAAVFVLDNSASLSRRAAAGETLLETAKAAVAMALGTLEPGDSAALVLTVRDPAAPALDGLTRDFDALRAALKAVPPTEAAGQPGTALGRALALLANAPAVRREIHVFTDLQEEEEWGQPASAVAAPAGLSLRIHRLVPADPPPNATLAHMSLPATRLLASRPLPLSVEVKSGALPAAVLVNWLDEGDRPGALEIRLAAEETKRVTLPLAPRAPGSYAVPVWISGDEFTGDNRGTVSFTVQPKQSVLFLGPRPAFGLLPAAMAPGGDASLSGLEPVFADPSEADAQLAAKKPLMVVIPYSFLPATGALPDLLHRFVQEGGRLLVVPVPDSAGVPAPGPAWLHVTAGAPESPKEPLRLIQLVMDSWLRNPGDEERLNRVRVMRFLPLQWTVGGGGALLGLEDGRLLLTHNREGAGDVFVSGLAMTGDWSTLPFKPLFLVLAHELVLLGRTDDPDRDSALRAGDEFQSQRSLPTGRVKLRSDSVPPIEWQGDAADLPVPSHPGLWTIEAGTNRFRFAVSANFFEGRFKELQAAPVPAALGLPHTVETLDSVQDLASRIRRERKGLRLFHPFLIACLLALLAESLLANPRIKES